MEEKGKKVLTKNEEMKPPTKRCLQHLHTQDWGKKVGDF